MATPKPTGILGVRINQYQAISNLAGTVVTGMTANANFATPAPPLATITADKAILDAAIVAWGPEGNRGSHSDLLNLRAAARVVYNDLLAEVDYVNSTAAIAAGNDYGLMATIITSSNFGIKNAPSPQGTLTAPQDFRRVWSNDVSQYTPKLAWSKPLLLKSPGNVRSYDILRGTTNVFSTAVVIQTVTKTQWIDTTAAAATKYFYWVRGVNAAGNGVESAPLEVVTPVA